MTAETFTLAHLSDLHIAPLPRPTLPLLLNKRALGYLSWRRKRGRVHRVEILDALWRDLQTRRPDHVAITGDLVNISLPGEFVQAAAWLERLGAANWISVVPGNHDAYVAVPWAHSLGLWRDYMGDTPAAADGTTFPFVRRRGPLALIGLSSAHPTPPLKASGRLGGAQLAALERLLAATGAEGLCRVVMLHHPPLAPRSFWRKALDDAGALRAVIARRGAELVLHGHTHLADSAWLDSAAGPVAALGVPSGSAVPHGRTPGSHYHLYEIASRNDGWDVTVRARRYDAAGATFFEAGARSLALPRSA